MLWTIRFSAQRRAAGGIVLSFQNISDRSFRWLLIFGPWTIYFPYIESKDNNSQEWHVICHSGSIDHRCFYDPASHISPRGMLLTASASHREQADPPPPRPHISFTKWIHAFCPSTFFQPSPYNACLGTIHTVCIEEDNNTQPIQGNLTCVGTLGRILMQRNQYWVAKDIIIDSAIDCNDMVIYCLHL